MPVGLSVLDIDTDIINPLNGTSVTVSGVAIDSPTSGSVAIGVNTMIATTGAGNTVVGDSALALATTGQDNTAFGAGSLGGLTTGVENVAIGSQSGQNISTSNENTLLGYQAGFGDFALGLGNNNTLLGNRAGYNTSGSSNVFIGWTTALSATTGNNNIVIGSGADKATPTSSNSFTLGNSSIGVLRCAVTTITSLSDARDKKEIETLPLGLEFVDKLKPVKFVWNDRDENGKHDVEDFGFIAQDLKAVQEESEASYLNLVYDENPDKLEASYGKLLPVLVKAIQEMSTEIKSLKEEIETLKIK